jgi:hypothetical protein
MVIEVSKEIDVRRIGIDRYSLKTGLNLRTVMDLSLQVMKEPRGFIRVIQCVMAILAFATTVGFSTTCEYNVECPGGVEKEAEYEIEYPFSTPTLEYPNCGPESGEHSMDLPYDFSNAAEFFVATGVLSFLYTIIILVVYIFFHQTYAQNNKIPVIDLGVSVILSVFWLAGSSAWAQGVSDLKYYLHPDTIFKILYVCSQEGNECETVEDGSYGTLNASLILGFANFALWLSSLWFIYKETVFFQPPEATPETNQNQQTKAVGRV